MKKDLTQHQVGCLELTLGGHEFKVEPPSAARGILLMKVVTIGWQATLNPDSVSEETVIAQLGEDVVKSFGGDNGLDKLALGENVWQEMIDANIPLKDITMAARYAAFYWVFDESTADKITEAESAQKNGTALVPTDVELPKH